VKKLVCLAATASALLAAAPSGGGAAACAQQIVVTGRIGSPVATLSLTSCGTTVAGPWPAHVGRAGLATSRREGDGTTPAGTFRLGATVYGIAPNPGVHLRYRRLTCGDWWDEDPSSPTYNSFRHIACGLAPPFRGDSEALWRISPQYRYFAVIDYNADPVVPGRGSAIFLHVAVGATAGCVSLPEQRLVRLLRWLRPSAHPRIRIGIT
jgi:L,D-peptidoglycan transpeptidase YkuD (ErfK/YbiS/YcfS/YnhG family)